MTPSLFAATATTPGTSLVSAACRRTSSTTLNVSFFAPAADQDGVMPYFVNETAADIAAADFNSSRRVCRKHVMGLPPVSVRFLCLSKIIVPSSQLGKEHRACLPMACSPPLNNWDFGRSHRQLNLSMLNYTGCASFRQIRTTH